MGTGIFIEIRNSESLLKMFWYDTQYKHAEEARQRNKREDRKLKIEIESKNGMRSALKTEMDAVSKEQRRIKRELDRIRKSSMGPNNVFNGSPRRLQSKLYFHGKKAPKRKIGRVDPLNFFQNEYLHEDNITESELMRSIMLINCDSNSKENNEMFKKGQFNDLTTNSESTYITQQQNSLSNYDSTDLNNYNSSSIQSIQSVRSDEREEIQSLTDNTVLVNLLSPSSVNNSPVQITVESTEEQDVITQLPSDCYSNVDSETSRSSVDSNLSKRRHKSLDLSQLATLDMKSVKSDVTRRLSGSTAPSKSQLERRRVSDGTVALSKPPSKQLQAQRRTSDGHVLASTSSPVKNETSRTKPEEDEESRPVTNAEEENVERVLPKRIIKHAKDIPQPLNYNPEYYNPDGSLRAKWTLPDPDSAWEAAKNARYIRTSDRRDSEIELSVNDIFK
ncbi:hypothetical protein LOTGIDRAFT_236434 [Lottia gigantea]|uniref:Uncharacterized protein n=1 Tax=Lottia gigantea TaxID=225164 RepID=V3ZMV7_LOTGI|nr:hypothetical protein LOTGIDRAFT_236434 [Lottia gigantea]ESO83780.1 hypothetical protein LOTGIDRAFT_236434 [Lottia gigantea]